MAACCSFKDFLLGWLCYFSTLGKPFCFIVQPFITENFTEKLMTDILQYRSFL